MSRLLRIGFAILVTPSLVAFGQRVYDQREWTSSDGRKITASIQELDTESETVKMKRSDGLVFTVAFDQFAETDADLLRQAMKDSSGEPEQTDDSASEQIELPEKFELDDVPMVQQKGNFCVPASATMIAGYHGIETDQDQVAFLSSEGSFNNQGTYPGDMLLAMEKLGFDGRTLYWEKSDDFLNRVLPAIRKGLIEQGPIYISFKAGVFGSMGHGCVIIGYHDRKEELIFHNPWGHVFEKEYKEVATQGQGIVLIEPPEAAPIASEAFIEKIQEIVPKFEGNLLQLTLRLKGNGQANDLVWCSRHDARDDKRFAADTARDDGRKILDLAFHRNPAVFIPRSEDDTMEKFLFVTRPPEGGARFLVREITKDGWSEPELVTLGSLTRTWPTRIQADSTGKIIWELPMIELHPDD